MINSRQSVRPPETIKMRLRYQRLLTAFSVGLLIRVLFLTSNGDIVVLSPARRIVLVILTLRLLTLVHSSFDTVEQARPGSQAVYARWQTGILPFFFVAPLVIVSWATAWSTRGQLADSTSYALAASAIMFLVIVNFVLSLAKSAQASSMESEAIRPRYGTGKFVIDIFFYIASGLVIALCIVGLMVLSPEILDDTIFIGNFTVYVYLLLWIGQFAVWFFSNLLRRDQEAQRQIPQEQHIQMTDE